MLVNLMRRIYLRYLRYKDGVLYARNLGVRVGNGCRLIDCSYSTEPYLISMGDRVSATRVRFETHDGGVWVSRVSNPNIDIVKGIKIGNNVYIGYEAIILPGVCIGDNVVIGARSVVTRDLPSGWVYAGVPARSVRSVVEYTQRMNLIGDDTKELNPKDKLKYYKNKYKGVWL